MQLGFMHAKLAFVVLLYAYHGFSHVLFKELQAGKARWTSTQLRFWNEVSTILLFAIVFLIVLKSTVSMIWGIASLIGLAVLLMLGIKLYKNYRLKKGE